MVEMSIERTLAYLELFRVNPDKGGYVCVVCERPYKTYSGVWNHVAEHHCEEAIKKQREMAKAEGRQR